jgi:hypothetical protein
MRFGKTLEEIVQIIGRTCDGPREPPLLAYPFSIHTVMAS